MRKAINISLLISFLAVIMEPVTGIPVHKAAAALFLLLSMIHAVLYRKKQGAKRWLLPAAILLSFLSGLCGMIWDQIPIILKIHHAVSVAVVFLVGIHIGNAR